MAGSEFALIERFFATQPRRREDVLLGIGDDCALARVPHNAVLALTIDTLVAGVHFLADADPVGIGHKTLAVNLSDLAAMGAEPAWATLAMTLPEPDEAWLMGFCRGFFVLAEAFQVQLIGGNLTRGPLTLSAQLHGFVPEGQALRRAGARPGDSIYVTGTLGDAALALAARRDGIGLNHAQRDYAGDRLERPSPRIQQGLDLRGIASAAIDISDGLAQDLGHILEQSRVGATLNVDLLPLSSTLIAFPDVAIDLALAGGDDYELCFTVPAERRAELHDRASRWDCRLTEIGVIDSEPGLRCRRADGTSQPLTRQGYDHFR